MGSIIHISHLSTTCPLSFKRFLNTALITSNSITINIMMDTTTITTTMAIIATIPTLRDEESPAAVETEKDSKTHTDYHLLASAIY